MFSINYHDSKNTKLFSGLIIQSFINNKTVYLLDDGCIPAESLQENNTLKEQAHCIFSDIVKCDKRYKINLSLVGIHDNRLNDFGDDRSVYIIYGVYTPYFETQHLKWYDLEEVSKSYPDTYELILEFNRSYNVF